MKLDVFFLQIFLFVSGVLWCQSVRSDVGELPDYYTWKNTYREHMKPTILGEWGLNDPLVRTKKYVFQRDGKAEIHQEKSKMLRRWKQRKDGKVYFADKVTDGEKAVYKYVGFVAKGMFVRDDLDTAYSYRKLSGKPKNKESTRPARTQLKK